MLKFFWTIWKLYIFQSFSRFNHVYKKNDRDLFKYLNIMVFFFFFYCQVYESMWIQCIVSQNWILCHPRFSKYVSIKVSTTKRVYNIQVINHIEKNTDTVHKLLNYEIRCFGVSYDLKFDYFVPIQIVKNRENTWKYALHKIR